MCVRCPNEYFLTGQLIAQVLHQADEAVANKPPGNDKGPLRKSSERQKDDERSRSVESCA